MPRPSIASPLNTGSCERGWDINASFTGAGAAVLAAVKTRGLSVGASTGPATKNTRQAVGKYTLFIDPANLGGSALAGVRIQVHTNAGIPPMVGKYLAGSLNIAAGTIQVEFWDLVATPAIADPPAGSFVDVLLQFFDGLVGP